MTPYAPDTARRIAAGPIEHVADVAVTGPAGTVPLDVAAAGGLSVIFDESWAPHVQATAVLPVPADVDELDALDPRTGARLTVSTGYRDTAGTLDVHPFVDLGLRGRVIKRPDNSLTLTASSDEALLQDDLWTAVTPAPVSRSGLVEAVDDILGASLPTVTLDAAFPAGYRADRLTELELPTGATPWSVAAAAVDDCEAWLYDDGLRGWHLVARPELAGTSRAVLATGPAGTLTSSEAGLSRDDWANGVYLRSEWRDGAGVDHVIHSRAVIASGDPFAPAAAGPKWARYERRTPTTQTGANAAAAAVLRREVSRGRVLLLTAPAMYWLRPGHTVTVSLPTGTQQRQLVARVDFDIPAGRMTVRTRQPVDVPITNGE